MKKTDNKITLDYFYIIVIKLNLNYAYIYKE